MVRIARLKTYDLDAATAEIGEAEIGEATIGVLHCDSVTQYVDEQIANVEQTIPAALSAMEPITITGHEISVAEASPNSSGVVSTGQQVIAGEKTFQDPVSCTGYAVTSAHLTTKGYVDDRISQGVKWNFPVLAILDVSTIQSPADGDRYIASVTNGDFVINHVYTFESDSDSWMDRNPEDGTVLYVIGGSVFTDQTIVYNGTAWVSNGNTVQHQSLIGAGALTHAQIDSYLDQSVKQAAEVTHSKVNTTRVTAAGTVSSTAPRPITFYASMSTQMKPEFANAPVTVTLSGSPSISNGKLVTTTTQAVGYTGTAFDGITVGTVSMKFTPAYSGIPATNQFICRVASADSTSNSRMDLSHYATTGKFYWSIWDSSGTVQATNATVDWLPVSGQEYEIEVCWDMTSLPNHWYTYVDGICVNDFTKSTTFTRGASNYLRLGAVNASFREVRMYSNCVHHGEAYTPVAVDASAIQAYGGATIWGDDSTSPDTGALRVIGGAGITNALNVGGAVKVTSLTSGATSIYNPDLGFLATFSSSIRPEVNLCTAGFVPSVTGSAPTITNGKLVIPANSQISFAIDGNVDAQQTGCIRFKYTPAYSGIPAQNAPLMRIAGLSNNAYSIFINHLSVSGNIALTMYDAGGSAAGSGSYAWSPTSGTEYDFELDFNAKGTTVLYINGASVISFVTSLVRTANTVLLFPYAPTAYPMTYRDVSIWRKNLHTAAFTAPAALTYTPALTVQGATIYGPDGATDALTVNGGAVVSGALTTNSLTSGPVAIAVPNLSFYASYTSVTAPEINLVASPVAPTVTGTASISSNKLLLAVSSSIAYTIDSNVDAGMTGCVRMKITPSWTGTPTTDTRLFTLNNSGNTFSEIYVFHRATDGLIVIMFRDTSSNPIWYSTSPVWAPTSGTEYDFELNWNMAVTGFVLYVNGVAVSSHVPSFAQVRASVTRLIFTTNSQYALSVRDVAIYRMPQHSSTFAVPALLNLNSAISGNLSLTGTLTAGSALASTSKTTGAIITSGGIGASAASTLAGVTCDSLTTPGAITGTLATASSSKTTGAVILTGGIGASAASTLAGVTCDSLTTAGVITSTNATAASSKTTGAVKITGGIGASAASYFAAVTADSYTTAGQIKSTSSTAATSKTTGAITATGGISAGAASVLSATTVDSLTTAGAISSTLTTASSSKTTGAVVTSGGFGASAASTFAGITADSVTSAGRLTINSTENADATGTVGALVCKGGIAVVGEIWGTSVHFGGASITGPTTIMGTTTVPTPVNATDAATKAYVDSVTTMAASTSFSTTVILTGAVTSSITVTGYKYGTGFVDIIVPAITSNATSSSTLTGSSLDTAYRPKATQVFSAFTYTSGTSKNVKLSIDQTGVMTWFDVNTTGGTFTSGSAINLTPATYRFSTV